jgi:hypothetical protein
MNGNGVLDTEFSTFCEHTLGSFFAVDICDSEACESLLGELQSDTGTDTPTAAYAGGVRQTIEVGASPYL